MANTTPPPNKWGSRMLPESSPLGFAEFYKAAPEDSLERAISKIESASDEQLPPIERERLKILLRNAIHQDSLADKINNSHIDELHEMHDQVRLGVGRFLQKNTGVPGPSPQTSSYVSSEGDTSNASPISHEGPQRTQQGGSRQQRPNRKTLRQSLLYRDSNRCAISHYADVAGLKAAHILPFSVKSLEDPFWDMLRLFLGPNFDTLHKSYTGKGIDRIDNAWILSLNVDIAFTEALCYLEPISGPETTPDVALPAEITGGDDIPNSTGEASYIFRWLDESREPLHYGRNHPLRQGHIKTGDTITLSTVDSVKYPLPNRYLLMIQAAIYKLNKEFKALADVFPEAYRSDDESVSCFGGGGCEEDYWDESYESEGYRSRVKSWLDQCAENSIPLEGFKPLFCGPVGERFGEGFSPTGIMNP